MTQMMEAEMLPAPVSIPNAGLDTRDEFLYGPAVQLLLCIYLLVKMLAAGLAATWLQSNGACLYMGCERLFAHIPART